MRLCFAAHGVSAIGGCVRLSTAYLLSLHWQGFASDFRVSAASSTACASDVLLHHALDMGEPIRALGGRGCASSVISVVWARLAWAASTGGESCV